MDAVTTTPVPVNETVRTYAPGSPERATLEKRVAELAGERVEPDRARSAGCSGWEVASGSTWCSRTRATRCSARRPTRDRRRTRGPRSAPRGPRRRGGGRCRTTTARRSSSRPPTCSPGRGATPLNAATMLGQSKTCYQAEIDAACELDRLPALQRRTSRRQFLDEQPHQLARRCGTGSSTAARGLRAGHHPVQLHGDRRQPADRAGADGQRRGVEAVGDASSSPRTT